MNWLSPEILIALATLTFVLIFSWVRPDEALLVTLGTRILQVCTTSWITSAVFGLVMAALAQYGLHEMPVPPDVTAPVYQNESRHRTTSCSVDGPPAPNSSRAELDPRQEERSTELVAHSRAGVGAAARTGERKPTQRAAVSVIYQVAVNVATAPTVA